MAIATIIFQAGFNCLVEKLIARGAQVDCSGFSDHFFVSNLAKPRPMKLSPRVCVGFIISKPCATVCCAYFIVPRHYCLYYLNALYNAEVWILHSFLTWLIGCLLCHCVLVHISRCYKTGFSRRRADNICQKHPKTIYAIVVLRLLCPMF